MPSKTVVQLFFDIISPYTYIQFELLTRQRPNWQSMSLNFTPVAIGALMRNADNNPPMLVPAKAKYMMQDLSRLTKFHKVTCCYDNNRISGTNQMHFSLISCFYLAHLDSLQAAIGFSRIRLEHGHNESTTISSFCAAAIEHLAE